MTRVASTDGRNESDERSSCLPLPQWPAGSDPFVLVSTGRSTGQQQPANVPQPGFSQVALPPADSKLPASGCQRASQWQSLARQDSDFQVEARAGNVMAGAGVAAGLAPYVRHQPSGDVNGPEESRAC